MAGTDRATELAPAGQVGTLPARLREVPLTGSEVLHPSSPLFGDLA
ncbi:hypothetical protein SAMN05444920_11037 [Nonomuraea solani]|uniref:Uncharacterized protein n=1 Tax=Nonomuraea solani TaxID=1144553 RepID=A0A1H6EHD7_9ACTN|nr:hypothetical protein [Nonomuraea solani]SEG96671.1 hypothetical protein SAMN05444920_11037 [Nonomuraea solani]